MQYPKNEKNNYTIFEKYCVLDILDNDHKTIQNNGYVERPKLSQQKYLQLLDWNSFSVQLLKKINLDECKLIQKKIILNITMIPQKSSSKNNQIQSWLRSARFGRIIIVIIIRKEEKQDIT